MLRSEGERARLVNIALGQKEATILNAEGQAEAVRQRAAAAAESVRKIADTTNIPGVQAIVHFWPVFCVPSFSFLSLFGVLK